MRTGFDGGFSGDFDPEFEMVLESAERLLRSIELGKDNQPGGLTADSLEVTLRLLLQRQRMLENQLWAIRAVFSTSLPPIRGLELDSYLEPSSQLERRLVRMLDMLSEAVLTFKEKLKLERCPFALPEPPAE